MTPTQPSKARSYLSPNLNPTGLASAASALWAGGVMIWNATHHQGVIDPQVIVAALAAAAFLYTRFKVTPTAAPKDGAGNSLVAFPKFELPASLLPSYSAPLGYPAGGGTVMTGGATSPSSLTGSSGTQFLPDSTPPMASLPPTAAETNPGQNG